MKHFGTRQRSWLRSCGLAGLLLGIAAAPAAAQLPGGGAGGASGAGGAGGMAGGTGLLGGSGGSPLGGGGTSGGSLLGSSSSGVGTFTGTMTGTSSTSRGSYSGSRGGGGFTGTTNIFPQVPSPLDPFQGTYFNALAQGQSITTTTNLLGTTNTVATFGQPSFGTQTNTTTANVRSGGSSSTTAVGGFNTVNLPRAPSFVTTLGFTPPPVNTAKLLQDLSSAVARSSVLSAKDAIKISIASAGPNQQVVVLQGVVPDARQRRLAESLIRVTPGVHDVRNDLVVRPSPASSP
jgi:hypothetical protein